MPPADKKKKHKAKINDKQVEVYHVDEGDPLTDGWYVDLPDGRSVKTDPQLLFELIEVETPLEMEADLIERLRNRIMPLLTNMQSVEDFTEVVVAVNQANQEAHSYVLNVSRTHPVDIEPERLRLGGVRGDQFRDGDV